MPKRGTTKFKSSWQEKDVASKLYGKVQIASGALDDKADVRTKEFLVECKTTSKARYVFHVSTWNTLRKQAMKLGLCPLLVVDYNDDERFLNGRINRFVILREDDYDYYSVYEKYSPCRSFYFGKEPIFNTFQKQVTIDAEFHPDELYRSEYIEFKEHLVRIPWKDFEDMIMRIPY